MNYRFLSLWALVACMYTTVKANHLPKVTEKPQIASSSLKIGYVDVEYVLGNLPEAKRNSAEIQSFQKQLDNQITIKVNELQEKANAFQQQASTLTEAQKNQKYKEFHELQLAAQKLEEQKHAKIAEKYRTVMQPLHDKIQEVIQKIATEYAYAFILSKSTEAGPVVLFAQKAFDISELVLEQLKALPPKEAQPPVVALKTQSKTPVTKPVKKK